MKILSKTVAITKQKAKNQQIVKNKVTGNCLDGNNNAVPSVNIGSKNSIRSRSTKLKVIPLYKREE